jgi:predicted short-subunit dehydrogenase-like oxidoreductase (DUF2520 family)
MKEDRGLHHRFAIIGAGTVGRALARLLVAQGYEFLGAASRSIESARAACEFAGAGRAVSEPTELASEADLVFITTPDDAIAPVCSHLGRSRALRSESVVAHCSGALSSNVLADARSCGAHVGSLHPLQTLASPGQAVALLPGSYCCIEGDEPAVEVLQCAAREIGMHALRIRTEAKPLYHAAATISSNYLVALQNAALKLALAAGIDRADSLPALLPLIKGTVSNIEALGVPAALTGPVARGDTETAVEVLQCAAREAVEVALDRGTLTREQAGVLLDLLG